MDKYFVHFVDDDPVLVYGPYGLKQAKDFARIGSIPGKSGGGRRAVFSGPTPSSRLVRVYEEGERVWPRTLAGVQSLEKAEVPRVLAPKPKKGSSLRLVANPVSGSVRIPDRSLGVRLHSWHSSMDDPIYTTGSLIYAGQPVPRELLAETIGALQSLYRRTKKRSEKAELKDLAIVLIAAGF